MAFQITVHAETKGEPLEWNSCEQPTFADARALVLDLASNEIKDNRSAGLQSIVRTFTEDLVQKHYILVVNGYKDDELVSKTLIGTVPA